MSDIEQKQRADDDALIPNPGDVREVVQRGAVRYGDCVKEIDITFQRKRNDQGGVDVVACMPPLGIMGKSEI
jgi:hypothetical protein